MGMRAQHSHRSCPHSRGAGEKPKFLHLGQSAPVPNPPPIFTTTSPAIPFSPTPGGAATAGFQLSQGTLLCPGTGELSLQTKAGLLLSPLTCPAHLSASPPTFLAKSASCLDSLLSPSPLYSLSVYRSGWAAGGAGRGWQQETDAQPHPRLGIGRSEEVGCASA